MAGRIPQPFIDDLLDRVDIVDVVGSRLDLRKSGKNYAARCPFHDEKTPSFTVSPDKQFFYCFGCGAGGNAIGFVMDYDRTDFPEAVEKLAHQCGLEVPREAAREQHRDGHRKKLYDILERADRHYRSQLREHPAAITATRYLKDRGLTGEIARRFGIGFAPPGWEGLMQALAEDDDTVELLKEAGLLVDRPEDNKLYDRFRNRIIFPIRDTRGRTIGFGGRVLGDDKPKYLNSPETPVFHKGRELYGLFEAHKTLREIPSLLVVEGYMDVVALSQHGIHNSVATLGTAATAEHLEKLYRYTPEVVFCFDGDEAGRKAASRALETCLPVMTDGRSARFLFLPEGEDPDTLVRKTGAEGFEKLVVDAQPLSDFLFSSLSGGLNLKTEDGKARLSKLAGPQINRIPPGVFRQLLLKRLAQLTDMDVETLETIIAPPPPSTPPPATGEEPPPWDEAPPIDEHHGRPARRDAVAQYRTRIKLPPCHNLIALLIYKPALADRLAEDLAILETLETDDVPMLLNLVKLLKEHPEYTLNHILGYWRGVYGQEQGETLARIAANDLLRPPGSVERDDETELQDIIRHLKREARRNQPMQLWLEQLAAQDSLTTDERKALFDIWHSEAAGREGSDEINSNIKQLLAKPVRRGS